MPVSAVTSTAYGSAVLETAASQALKPALDDPESPFLVLGCDDLNGSTGYLWDVNKAPGHAMTFGPTRKGGKGVSSIIPALLTYTGSMLVIDPKGENAWITAERRRAMGQRVVILDPWDEVNRRYGSKVGISELVTKYNPLGFLDPSSPGYADDIAAIADALVISPPGSPNSHWTDSAGQLVAGGNAAAVETHPPGAATLRDVRQLVTLTDEELETELQTILEGNPDSLAARKLRRFSKFTPEIGSIRSTAETQTAFMDSETLLDSMETDAPPFDLAELATGKVTLFLVLPVDRLESHGRWLRLIITLAIRTIARQPTPPPLPVFFVLDEMGTIGRLAMVENAYGLMAGLGIRLWGFLQDLPQLQRDYPNSWETFISNSSVIQILKAHDKTTSEYVSSYMGNGTVNAKTGSQSMRQKQWADISQFHETVNHWLARRKDKDGPYTIEQLQKSNKLHASEILVNTLASMQQRGITADGFTEWTEDTQLMARPLMDPDEVRRLPDDLCLLLVPGSNPLKLYRPVYYKHPLFKGKFRQNPLFKMAEPERPAPPPADRPRYDKNTGKPISYPDGL